MRFPCYFRRQKGSVSTDPALPGTNAPPATGPTNGQDNMISHLGISKEGWPVQRVAACWTTTAGSPTPLNASLYFWEENLQAWILVNSTAVSMSPGILYFFDVAVCVTPPQTQLASGAASNSKNTGAVEVCLVVSDPGAQVNGIFNVAVGMDLSSVGT